ncbi:hypothetical protein LOAG_04733 [Loa loa]|uniref:Uncharacterized protein n=1 Tax=Loa loa TaxID=7209 RepID=A0A1S0U1S4_LOALO|nr:hypothetical protein LOAG_04733 [Loa loa]EFO23754.1 hypothetical protein LOAG_04733 [Loa loa]
MIAKFPIVLLLLASSSAVSDSNKQNYTAQRTAELFQCLASPSQVQVLIQKMGSKLVIIVIHLNYMLSMNDQDRKVLVYCNELPASKVQDFILTPKQKPISFLTISTVFGKGFQM